MISPAGLSGRGRSWEAAAVAGLVLLTRGATRYRTYFPRLEIIAPSGSGELGDFDGAPLADASPEIVNIARRGQARR